MTEIRLLLKDLRQAKDISQEELARALNVSRQSIISLEQGEYLPSAPLLISLMEFFSCPIDQLVEGINIRQINSNNRKGGETAMALAPWNPLNAIDRMQEEMNEMVERTFGRGDWSRSIGPVAGAMNVHENDKEYEIEIQAPGFTDADINVEMSEDNVLNISGNHKAEAKKDGKNMIRREWEHAEFSRSVRFPTGIKADKVEARLENGTLNIIAPKLEPVKPKTKKIEIKKK